MSAEIYKVEKGSIAEEIGLEKGDKIISVNKEKFTDALEYRFLISEEYIELEIETKDGENVICEIEKEEYEDLGIEFTNPLIDKPRSCRNKCIFCFIDQLPKGLRESLYFKDDDTRLSFLNGNYVTLTNISDDEIDKIIKIRLSPINISVHTTCDELRKFMLNNKFAGGIKEKIEKLTSNKITVNCQIVLVKGVNDKEHLEKTIRDLSVYFPYMHSISVVPIGITDHRENLFKVDEFNREDANSVIELVLSLQNEFLKKYGSRIVYLADEFYIMSDYDLPSPEVYEDFPQIENGVGMMSSFLDEVNNALKKKTDKKTKKTVVTGKLAYPYFLKIKEKIESMFPSVKLNIIKGENKLFGEKITVTGLLCGRDIIDSLKGVDIGDNLLLSIDTLRAEKDLFLDDMTVLQMENILHTKILFNEINGEDFVDKIFL
ncbi:MAG: DUF512 domain-containing protein [Ruminococcaceae bacterium]|nr:DUF512 domain-containing protein [Oscillospiraceae bacterium]